MDNLESTVSFVIVATVLVPFIVQVIKSVLKRFKKKVDSQHLVMLVCGCMGLGYALVTQFLPEQILTMMSAVGVVTFITSRELYDSVKK
jgi:uncharacterized protein YacL